MATGITFPVTGWDGRLQEWARTGILMGPVHGGTTTVSGIRGFQATHGDGGRTIAAPGAGLMVLDGCGSRATVDGAVWDLAGTHME